jgi:hypothetical protein
MSLDFSVKDVKDATILARWEGDREYWSHEVEAVVHWSYAIGMNRIVNEADRKLWYRRYVAIQMAMGYGKDDLWVTPEMLDRLEGLTTNVSQMTDTQFNKRLVNVVWDHVDTRLRLQAMDKLKERADEQASAD